MQEFLGLEFLLIFEFFSSFVSGLSNVTITLAMLGGLLSMAWYILIARKLGSGKEVSDVIANEA